jgi:hypothetical protein
MLEWLVSNGSEKMSKEVIVDLLSYYTCIYLDGLRKDTENIRQNSLNTEI